MWLNKVGLNKNFKMMNMKKNVKKEIKNIGHRGDVQGVISNFGLEMRIVRNAPKSYFSREGGVKKTLEDATK